MDKQRMIKLAGLLNESVEGEEVNEIGMVSMSAAQVREAMELLRRFVLGNTTPNEMSAARKLINHYFSTK